MRKIDGEIRLARSDVCDFQNRISAYRLHLRGNRNGGGGKGGESLVGGGGNLHGVWLGDAALVGAAGRGVRFAEVQLVGGV